MFENRDLILLACMLFIADTAEIDEEEVYDLLTQEQKDRFDSLLKLAKENMDNDEVSDQCVNQLKEILKTL
jgi:hypothetical protein